MIDTKFKPKHGDTVVKAKIRKFVMNAKTKAIDLEFVIYAYHKKFHFHARTECLDDEWEMTCSKRNFSWDRKRYDVVGYHIGYCGEDDKGYIGSWYFQGAAFTPIIQSFLQIEENYGRIWFDYLEIWDNKECLERFWKDIDGHTYLKYEPNKLSWVYNESSF